MGCSQKWKIRTVNYKVWKVALRGLTTLLFTIALFNLLFSFLASCLLTKTLKNLLTYIKFTSCISIKWEQSWQKIAAITNLSKVQKLVSIFSFTYTIQIYFHCSNSIHIRPCADKVHSCFDTRDIQIQSTYSVNQVGIGISYT